MKNDLNNISLKLHYGDKELDNFSFLFEDYDFKEL